MLHRDVGVSGYQEMGLSAQSFPAESPRIAAKELAGVVGDPVAY